MKINKRQKILSAGAKLISRKSFYGSSFQDIADAVGLHKSTLFHYFRNKEELLLEILKEGIDEASINLKKIIAEKELEPQKKLEKAILSHLTGLVKHRNNVNIYLNDFRSLSKKKQVVYLRKRKEYEKDIESIVVEMKKKGYFNGLDTRIVTFGLLGMLNWVVKWYKNKGPWHIEEVANVFYQMIT